MGQMAENPHKFSICSQTSQLTLCILINKYVLMLDVALFT